MGRPNPAIRACVSVFRVHMPPGDCTVQVWIISNTIAGLSGYIPVYQHGLAIGLFSQAHERWKLILIGRSKRIKGTLVS